MVQFIERLLNWNISPELSSNGWIIAIVIGMIFPVKNLLRWKSLGNDLRTQTVVSAWSQSADDCNNELLEEFLQESSLLWSRKNRPSDLRLNSRI